MAARDPILDLQRSTRRIATVGVVVSTAAAVWAFWPFAREPRTLASTAESIAPSRDISTSKLAFDPGAFEAQLWTPPPQPPPKVVVQQPAPPALKLQLIGISRDNGHDGTTVLRGVLYDPDSDRLLIVASGEKVELAGRSPIVVSKLTPDAIELQDGENTRRLTLNDDRKQQ